MTGGPYRKSKLKYTVDEWVGWLRSLLRNEPKEYELLKRRTRFFSNAGFPGDKFLQKAIDKVEDMLEITSNKYYRRAQNNPETLDNYIVMPGPGISKLLVGKDRIHYGYYWEEAHLRLQKDKYYMPTLKQFVDFKNLLESGGAHDGTGAKVTDSEAAYILEDLLEDNCSGEWLDASFIRRDQRIKLGQNHRYERYLISTWQELPLEQNCLLYNFLEQDFCKADVFGSANSQGMPTEFGEILFYGPAELEPTVTIFGNWGKPSLICNVSPEVKLSTVGVRPVKLKLD